MSLRMLRSLVLLSAVMLWSTASVGQIRTGITPDQLRRAIWISQLAAEKQMPGLSLRAVRDALQHGPPETALSERAELINEIQLSVAVTASLWQKQQIPTDDVFETLKSVVFPAGRPEEMFVYQQTSPGEAPSLEQDEQSVGMLLVLTARRAGRLNDLKSILTARLEMPKSRIDAWLLLLRIAIEENDPAQVTLLRSFAADHLDQFSEQTRLSLALTTLRLWPRMAVREQLRPVMISLAESPVETDGFALSRCCTLIAGILAREALIRERPEEAERFLDRADEWLALQEQSRTGVNRMSRIEHHLEFAKLQLEYGQPQQASRRLQGMLDAEIAADNEHLAVTRIWQLGRYLEQLPPEDRYTLLFSCIQKYRATDTTVEFPPALNANDDARSRPLRTGSTSTTPMPERSPEVVSPLVVLFRTAKDIGKTAELEAFVNQRASESKLGRHWTALFQLQSGNATAAQESLSQILSEVVSSVASNGRGREVTMDLLAGVCAIEFPETRETGLKILDALRRIELVASPTLYLSAAAMARVRGIAEQDGTSLRSLQPQIVPDLWIPSVTLTEASARNGDSQPIWVAESGVISHQGGLSEDSLYFPWPLSGNFEFSVETFSDTGTAGGFGFCGLNFLVAASSDSLLMTAPGSDPWRSAYRVAAPGQYSTHSIQAADDAVVFRVNGHEIWREPRSQTDSPWLRLTARNSREGCWRLPKFSGQPVIPREVRLLDDPRMRSWHCGLLNQSRPNGEVVRRQSRPPEGSASQTDWALNDGTLTGRRQLSSRRIEGFLDQDLQSLIQYDRPLVSGDQVRWEFEYAPGATEVHPSLGRTAFLLRPEGVSVHWISTGPEEWRLVPADNEQAIPEAQRGSKPLPLVPGWNHASLTLREHTAVLTLNDTVISEHKMAGPIDPQFGFFHFCDQTDARVRNVVLNGKWPDTISEHHIARLTKPAGAPSGSAAARTARRILGTLPFERDAGSIVRYAASLAPESRLTFLTDWVLPDFRSTDRSPVPEIRLHGDFVPRSASATDDAVRHNFASLLFPQDAGQGNSQLPWSESQLVSPAGLLIRTARELSRTAALREAVQNMPSGTQEDHQALLALTVLISVADGRLDDAAAGIRQMTAERASGSDPTRYGFWPELLVADECLQRPQLRPALQQLLSAVRLKPSGWRGVEQVEHLHSFRSVLAATEITEHQPLAPVPPEWSAFRLLSADQRCAGIPDSAWTVQPDGSFQHTAGSAADVLSLGRPLSGTFSVEFELVPVNGEYLQPGYGGLFFPLPAKSDTRVVIPWGRTPVVLSSRAAREASTAGVSFTGNLHCRLTVSGDHTTLQVNEQEVISEEIAPSPPWLCFRAASTPGAAVKNIRISGQPETPDQVSLDTGNTLMGWTQPWQGGPLPFLSGGRSALDWRSEEVTILGTSRTSNLPSNTESLLPYARPMLEDGTVDYSFYFQGGACEAHPAIGRTVFLLDHTQGVLLHTLSDGLDNPHEIDPGNYTANPEWQLSKPLTLLEKDWNSVSLRLTGDVITLILNDSEIFRGPLPENQQRNFGVFHYRENRTAKVRGLRWTGQWNNDN